LIAAYLWSSVISLAKRLSVENYSNGRRNYLKQDKKEYRIILVRRIADPKETKYPCDNCVFLEACQQTDELPLPFGSNYCVDGYYWEIEE
jgi:CRISPR/Cas system-associated exonuclease Cas4 (RecB family)